VNKNLVNSVHKHILGGIKPDLTFILKVTISKALHRLKKRKIKNRYDKFSKNFYIKVQNAFIKLAKKNKKRYFVIDNSKDSKETEKIILTKFMKVLNK
jgi:thymidylate kinase